MHGDRGIDAPNCETRAAKTGNQIATSCNAPLPIGPQVLSSLFNRRRTSAEEDVDLFSSLSELGRLQLEGSLSPGQFLSCVWTISRNHGSTTANCGHFPTLESCLSNTRCTTQRLQSCSGLFSFAEGALMLLLPFTRWLWWKKELYLSHSIGRTVY